MTFKKWVSYIKENEDMIWLKSFFKEISTELGFYISDNDVEEYFWYFWILDKEKKYYLQKENREAIWHTISFLRQYNVILKTLCFMGIYNQESKLYSKYSSIFAKLINEGNNVNETYKWMYVGGRFTYLQPILAVTKKILDKNKTSCGKGIPKLDVKNLNIVIDDFLYIDENFRDFSKFRNIIMHSEVSIYYILESESIENERKKSGNYEKEKETINSLKIAKKMMPIYLSQKEINNEYNFRVEELNNWFKNIIKSLKITEKEYLLIFEQLDEFCKYNEKEFNLKRNINLKPKNKCFKLWFKKLF